MKIMCAEATTISNIQHNSHLLVVVPYHNKDLKRGILLSIIAQTGMTIDEFISYL